jgi:hypothetical protein
MRKYETEFKLKVVKSLLDGDGGVRTFDESFTDDYSPSQVDGFAFEYVPSRFV